MLTRIKTLQQTFTDDEITLRDKDKVSILLFLIDASAHTAHGQ